jgi:LacI family transcriptional regulator
MGEVTIYTLAKELNMTPSMVSRAFNPEGKINEEKRKLVLETAKKYNFSPNRFASRLSMKPIRIGVFIRSRYEVNTKRMLLGIKKAYEKLKDYKITYDITLRNPVKEPDFDYEAELMKYKDYDGVIVAGLSFDKYTNALLMLCKANKNIVQVQAVNENVPCLFASKHSEETSSKLAADFLFNCLKKSKSKNILLFTGDKKNTQHLMAEKYFKKALDERGLILKDSISMMDSEDYFSEILPPVMEKYKDDIDGIYITSGFSRPLYEYMERKGLDFPLVAFDIHDGIKEYLEKDIVSAAINQNVALQMESAFTGLSRYIIANEKCPEMIYTDIDLVLKSNMHQFE